MFDNVIVFDTETTGLQNDCEVCEVAAGKWTGDTWHVSSSLYGTETPIPYEASATNHISRKMLAGKPILADVLRNNEEEFKRLLPLGNPQYKWYVAHNSEYDTKVMNRTYQKAGLREPLSQANTICTLRLSKHIFGSDIVNMPSLGYMRYFLDVPVDDNVGAHRGGDDVIVNALIFEALVVEAIERGLINPENDIMIELNQLCWSSFTITKWAFGKHKGQLLTETPDSYYRWAIENMNALDEKSEFYSADLAKAVFAEVERRGMI